MGNDDLVLGGGCGFRAKNGEKRNYLRDALKCGLKQLLMPSVNW